MLHQETADQGPGSSEPGLAVHGDRPIGVLRDGEEPLDYVVVRGSSIIEEQVVVSDPGRRESGRVIQLVVEPYNGRNVVPPVAVL